MQRLARILAAICLVGGAGLVTATQPAEPAARGLDPRHEFVACAAGADVDEPRALPGTVSRVNLADRSVQEIGDVTVAEYGARVSHRGDQVAFCAIAVSKQAGLSARPEVVVCDPEGGNRRTLYTAPAPALLMQLDWSADDRHVAVVQARIHQTGDAPPANDEAIGDIVVVDVASETAKVVTHGIRPRWSSDGTLLAFVTRYRPRDTGGAEVTELVVARWDAMRCEIEAARAVLTSRKGALIGVAGGFTWIGGTHLLAAAMHPSGLRIVDAARGAPRSALAQVRVDDLAASPDGSSLAVAASREGGERAAGIYHVDVETTTARKVTTLPGLVNGMQFLGDGTTLVVSCFSPGPLGFPAGPRIWTVDLQTGAIEQPFPDRAIAIDDGLAAATVSAFLIGQTGPEQDVNHRNR